MTDVVLVLTTVPDGEVGETIAQTLIQERLAACVNLFSPMRSIYRWKGAVESADERQAVIKTSASLVDRVQHRLRELHPYDVPEVLVIAVLGGSDDYLRWIADQVENG